MTEEEKLKKREYARKYWYVYHSRNKEKINRQARFRRSMKREDPFFRLKSNIRTRVSSIFSTRGLKKRISAYKYLGCSFEELFDYIEKQFDNKMNWSNYGSYWSIDHIIPLDLAENEEELYKLNHYINLRPITCIENISKGIKMRKKDVEVYKRALVEYCRILS